MCLGALTWAKKFFHQKIYLFFFFVSNPVFWANDNFFHPVNSLNFFFATTFFLGFFFFYFIGNCVNRDRYANIQQHDDSSMSLVYQLSVMRMQKKKKEKKKRLIITRGRIKVIFTFFFSPEKKFSDSFNLPSFFYKKKTNKKGNFF